MRCKLVAFVLMWAWGCGPQAPSRLVPSLPASGDRHTAKPTVPDGFVEDPWAARSDLIEPPAALDPSPLTLPVTQRFTLPNGLIVVAIEDHRLPMVTMRLGVRAGARDESAEQIGVSQVAAAMLDKGNARRSATEIAESVDSAGGALVAAATNEATYVSCRVLSENAKACLSLFRDVVMTPAFPEQELPQVRQRLIAEVRARQDDAGALARAHFRNELWGDDHYRGRVPSIRAYQNISREALKQWHARLFKPNNAVLVISGDFSGKSLRREVGRAFSTWRRGRVAERTPSSPPEVRGIRVRLVDKPSQTQSHIVLGHVGVSVRDDDFHDVVVFDHALGGGGFASRLMKVIRAREGKTYGARSGFDKDVERGAYRLSSFTRTGETIATIDLMIDEMRKLAAQGPTDAEVAAAVAYLSGSYLMAFQSADDYSRALLDAELQSMGVEYVRDFAVRVGAVTRAKAAEAARKRLDPDNFVLTIVGAAKTIAPALERRGWKPEVVSYLEPVSAAERKHQDESGVASVSKADQAKAVAILAKALAVKGGQRIASVRSFTLKAKATLSLGQQSVPVELSRSMVLPDKLQLRMKAMGGTQIITIAGQSGWVAQELGSDRNVQDIGAADLQAAKSQLWRDQELVLLRYQDEDTVAEVVDTTPEHHVINLRKGRWEVRLFINKKTFYLDKMTYQEGGELSSESYSDYRKVDGILVAHRRQTSQKMMGQAASFDIALERIEFDKNVPASTFVRPR